ncbi:hypothetical protein AGMMS50230_21460 [Spirochaetia bacterium]|nr:hypothetical protein AGMMS50230_21460 [Spirochaetia bacterium]
MKKKVHFLTGAVFTVMLFAVLSCGVGEPSDITYTITPDRGTDGPTAKLIFTFVPALSTLMPEDITLTNGTGNVTKGGLNGNALDITVNTAGTITVKITKSGVESAPKTVRVYNTPYAIGETGPGGGIIFYGPNTFTSNSKPCKYLEAAPADISGTFMWGSEPNWKNWAITPVGAAQATAIGTGYANTAAILAADTVGPPAALACRNYISPAPYSKNDWFLPSKDELNKLYENIGGLSGDFWSSSELTAHPFCAWFLSNGNWINVQVDSSKEHTYLVRPVRAF